MARSSWMPKAPASEPAPARDDLFVDDRAEAVVLEHPGAAELLGDREADEARLARGEHGRTIDLARGIPPLARLVRHVALDELLDDVAERLVVLVVDVALHVRLPLVSRAARRHVCRRGRGARTIILAQRIDRWHVTSHPTIVVLGIAVFGCRRPRPAAPGSADVVRCRGQAEELLERVPAAVVILRGELGADVAQMPGLRRVAGDRRCTRPRSGRSSRTPTSARPPTAPCAVPAKLVERDAAARAGDDIGGESGLVLAVARAAR